MKVSIGPHKENRRINIQIDKYDTWNLDHTLALIIYPALLQLKATKHGIPGEFAEVGGENYHDQMSFDFYSATTSECFDIKIKQWDEVMDKMIWAFQQVAHDNYDEKYHHGAGRFSWKPVVINGKELTEMIDENPDEHWYDQVGHQMHQDRIQEGLELFGHYFCSLWD
jgi:hypothetical protein